MFRRGIEPLLSVLKTKHQLLCLKVNGTLATVYPKKKTQVVIKLVQKVVLQIEPTIFHTDFLVEN